MVSMVTDVVVDRVGNVEGWNGPNNCLPFGVRHEKFLCWLRAAMVCKIVSLYWKSGLLLLCRAVMSNLVARCG